MQIDFDPKADGIYIRFRDGEIGDTVKVNKYIYVDVDNEKSPLGLEILFASRVLKNRDIFAFLSG